MNRLDLRLKAHYSDGRETAYLLVEIKVDGEKLVDFNWYATDLAQFAESIDNKGSFFIITCWCGQPECVGIKRGVNVSIAKGVVSWEVQEANIDKRLFFDEAEYKKVIARLKKQGNELIENLQLSGDVVLEITPDRNAPFFRVIKPNL